MKEIRERGIKIRDGNRERRDGGGRRQGEAQVNGLVGENQVMRSKDKSGRNGGRRRKEVAGGGENTGGGRGGGGGS